MRDQPLAAVILAAGLGTRMKSRTPKVLHPIAGRPMIDFVLEACGQAGIKRIVTVLNPEAPEVVSHIGGRAEVAFQDSPKGTGHALAQAPDDLLGEGDLVVVNGDQPLLRPETIKALVGVHRKTGAAATLGTVDDAARRDGRIVRDGAGHFERIVEWKDATAAQRRGSEINAGLYCFRGGSDLLRALAGLQPANSAGELYLTDLFTQLRPVEVLGLDDPIEAMGINDRVQLSRAEAAMRERILESLMLSGVTVVDPASTFVDAGVRIGPDTVLEPFSIVRGETVIGADCRIGPYAELRPVEVLGLEDPIEAMGINDRVQLSRAEAAMRERILERLMLSGVTVVDPASTFVDAGVRIGPDTVLEPFSIVRGETVIGADCRIGPYAEVRDSRIGDGCRIERSRLEKVRMAEGSDCGPFSRLRPGTEVGLRVHIGSFAEIVRSKIGSGTAVPHVSYLGDATVGGGVNIGAGTITANYDGERKHPTEIGDEAFVGVDTMFVAPRKMGRRSKTGAGSVVTKDIPDGTLAAGVPAREMRHLGDEGGS